MNFRSDADVRAEDNIREERLPFIISQYAASPRIYGILDNLRNEISPTPDLDLFYEKMFNIMAAEGIGLDTWGNIVGIPRTIQNPITGETVTLTDDEEYRIMLLFKALSNILDATIPTLTSLIRRLFPEIESYVINLEDYQQENGQYYNRLRMKIRWVFNTFIDQRTLTIFLVAGILCKGAGVGWGFYSTDTQQVFGFDGSGFQPFNQGVFDPYGIAGG